MPRKKQRGRVERMPSLRAKRLANRMRRGRFKDGEAETESKKPPRPRGRRPISLSVFQ